MRSIAQEHGSYSSDHEIVFANGEGIVRFNDGREVKCVLTGTPFIWKTRPLTGGMIPLNAERDGDARFYACSSEPTADGRRCFVFSSPLYTKILVDSQVDWMTQKALAKDAD